VSVGATAAPCSAFNANRSRSLDPFSGRQSEAVGASLESKESNSTPLNS